MFDLDIKDGIIRIVDNNGSFETYSTYNTKNIKRKVYGVYGVINYEQSKIIVVVDSAKQRGKIYDHPVYEISKISHYNLTKHHNKQLDALIKSFFELPGLYFSTYKLYNQQTFDKSAKNTEFIFNKELIKEYRAIKGKFYLECIQGYFSSSNGLNLISRRSCQRAGTRYFSRGCDIQGNCSNFVETEIIIENIGSYLQIRGSIPLIWSHNVDLKYSPTINISPIRESIKSENNHYERMKKFYSDNIIYLNLIKDYGYEAKICKLFESVCNKRKYIHFDFHKNIKNGSFPIDVSVTGFTGTNISQKAIIRTNCIDCLDRTNAMQFLIAERVLELMPIDKLKYEDDLMKMFYENGNQLAIQYAGTPALNSGVITEKPSLIPLKLKDGFYSLQRYFINRMFHGRLQRAYEILTRCKKGGLSSKSSRSHLILISLIFLFLNYILSKNKLLNMYMITMIFILYLIISFSSIIDRPTLKM